MSLHSSTASWFEDTWGQLPTGCIRHGWAWASAKPWVQGQLQERANNGWKRNRDNSTNKTLERILTLLNQSQGTWHSATTIWLFIIHLGCIPVRQLALLNFLKKRTPLKSSTWSVFCFPQPNWYSLKHQIWYYLPQGNVAINAVSRHSSWWRRICDPASWQAFNFNVLTIRSFHDIGNLKIIPKSPLSVPHTVSYIYLLQFLPVF